MWHSADGMGWWMLWGVIMMLLFWGAIIALGVWFVGSVSSRGGETPAAQPRARTAPLDVAKERYARGEISREEFEQIRRDLESG